VNPSARAALLVTLLLLVPVAHAQRRRAVRQPAAPCVSAVLTSASAISITPSNGFVFYGDFPTNAVWRVGKTGGTPKMLAQFPGFVPVLLTADAKHVFAFVRPHGTGSVSPSLHTLYAIPIDGGVPVTITEGVPGPVALRADSGFVYWVSYGTMVTPFVVNSDGMLQRARDDGSMRQTLASGLSAPLGLLLDDNFVYFSETGLALGNPTVGLMRMDKSSGVTTKLSPQGFERLVMVGSDLYLLRENYEQGLIEVSRMPAGGGTLTPLFTDRLAIPSSMAIVGNRIYYVTIQQNAAIVSRTLDGRDPITHLTTPLNSNILVDDCAIYVATTDQVLRKIAH